jgi:hypothetical protein
MGKNREDTPRGGEARAALGWREWVALPDLGIPAVKAKIDTGARTSALHTFDLEPYRSGGQLRVRFAIHPLQRRTDIVLRCDTGVIDHRRVRDSGGRSEMRYVIATTLVMGEARRRVELTLTSREDMLFRMLVGRTALAEFLVSPRESFRLGRKLGRVYRRPPNEEGRVP